MDTVKCKRCLINLDSLVRESINKQLEEIPQDERAADGQHDKRLLACRSCDYLKGETCIQCGAFAAVRAARKSAVCPADKW